MFETVATLVRVVGWLVLVAIVGFMLAAVLGVRSAQPIWSYFPYLQLILYGSVIGLGSLSATLYRSTRLWRALEEPEPGAAVTDSAAGEPSSLARDGPAARARAGMTPVQAKKATAVTEGLLYALALVWLARAPMGFVALGLGIDKLPWAGIDLLDSNEYWTAGESLFFVAYFGLFGYACALAQRLEQRLASATFAASASDRTSDRAGSPAGQLSPRETPGE